MSEQSTAANAARQSDADLSAAPLIAVAVATALAAFALIRVSANSASAWLGIALGIGLALVGGLLLGRWWPDSARASVGTQPQPDVAPAADPVRQDNPPPARTPEHVTVSALHDEEHVFADPAEPDEHAAVGSEPAQLDQHAGPEEAASVEDDRPTVEPQVELGHPIITPDMLINDDHPTVAMQIPAAVPVAIDDMPQAQALAAKDEVIRSLESIVNENRDRWAGFEAERQQLQDRIRDLEAELRVACELIEHGTQDAEAVGPQVLNRL